MIAPYRLILHVGESSREIGAYPTRDAADRAHAVALSAYLDTIPETFARLMRLHVETRSGES